jgi:hypothetical protein
MTINLTSTFTGDETVPGPIDSGSRKTRDNHYLITQPWPVVHHVWPERERSPTNPAQNLSELREVCHIFPILTSPAYT